jgi:hypothetical protein
VEPSASPIPETLAQRASANCKRPAQNFISSSSFLHDTHRVSSKILDKVCVGG